MTVTVGKTKLYVGKKEKATKGYERRRWLREREGKMGRRERPKEEEGLFFF
jgi:hypothetical protein